MQKTMRFTMGFFCLGFVVLFLLRLGYGYWTSPNGEPIRSAPINRASGQVWQFASSLKNYASAKVKRSASPVAAFSETDQKYEKIANIGLQSSKYDVAERNIRDLVKSSTSVIQFEQRSGLKGRRVARLAIGVIPNQFDSFVKDARTFGKLTELTINKSDKTNEYRQLTAQRVSLEKTRDALTKLKQRQGDITAMLALEKQMLSLEQQAQSLGVSLGDFDSENEFVTVKIVVSETGPPAIRNISFPNRALIAFVWTVKYYTFLWLGFAAAMIGALGVTLLWRFFMGYTQQIEAPSPSK